MLVFEKSCVDFKLLSLNVRGIQSFTKRRALFCWLNERKGDIVFLQETYSTKDVESTWKTQWQGKLYFSHGSNHSCGVTILVKDDVDFKLNSIISDDQGRYVITQAAQAHASRKRGIYKLFMVLESGRDLRERPVLGYKRPLTI